MPTVIRDNSIGQALGTLAGSLYQSPKDQWEAYAFKQRVANTQADTAKTNFELKQAQDQRRAQDAVIGQFNTMFQPGNFNVPATVEAPRPTNPEWQGPMPGVHNPAVDDLNGNLAFARAAANNAILRGGSPSEALDAAYKALGMGNVLAAGVPTNTATAAQTQTMLTGKLPDASIPLTPQALEEKRAYDAAVKLKEAVPISENGTLLTPEQGKAMGVQPDANGQYIMRPPAQPGGGASGPLGGTAIEAQATNALLTYQEKVRTRQPITPQEEALARWAWNTLYGPKTELRQTPGGGMDAVTIQPSIPEGFLPPGVQAPAATAPAAQQTVVPDAPPAPRQVTLPGGVSIGAGPAAPVPAMPMPTQPVSGQPAPGAPVTSGNVSVTAIRPGDPKTPPEHVIKKGVFTKTMSDNLVGMTEAIKGGYKPGLWDEFAKRAKPEGPGGVNAVTQMALELSRSPEANSFDQMALGFVNAVLRDESGAAVPEPELARYYFSLIPSYLDTPQQVQAKLARMQNLIDARLNSLDYNSFLEQSRRIREQDIQAGGIMPAAPAAGTPDRVKLRQDADAAIAAINASNLPDSEKAKRRGAVESRFNQMIGGQ